MSGHDDSFNLQDECEPQPSATKQTPPPKSNGADADTQAQHETYKARAKEQRQKQADEQAEEAGEFNLPDPPKGWPEFSAACMQGAAGEIVMELAPYTEAHPMGLLGSLLVSFGNVIGRQPYTRLSAATYHYTIENVVLVGDTGDGRKGEAADTVRRVMERVEPDWVKDCCPTSVGSGQGIITAVRDAIWGLNRKTNQHEIVDPGVEDKRLLVDEREFTRMLAIMNMDNSIVSPVVCQAFDCHPYLRPITKHNRETATNAHISIIGHITPKDLRAKLRLDLIENGFGNRFLFMCVRRPHVLDAITTPPELFDSLAEKLKRAVVFARGVEEVLLNDNAQELWRELYRTLCKGAANTELSAMGARGPVHVRRLAMLLALCEHKDKVEVVHLQTAMAIWRYSQDSIRWVLGSAATNTQAHTILEELKAAHPDGMSKSEINKVFNYRGLETVTATLSGLLAEGSVRRDIVKPLGRGRPKQIWYAVV